MRTHARLPWALLLLGLAGCASTDRQGPRSFGGPLVVPAGELGYYLFQEGSVELLDGKERQMGSAVPAQAGHPAAVGSDPYGGWAAAAYERGLYAVQLADGRLVEVEGVNWTAPPAAIGVRGGLAGTVEDGTIGLYRIADGKPVWKRPAREILAALGLSELHFVLPLSTDEILIVGFKEMGLLSPSDTIVLLVDRSGGSPVTKRFQPLPRLHELQACASDGQDLYVAGERDDERLLPGAAANRQLVPSLLVMQLDPETLSTVELVCEERAGGEVRVRQMAVGSGLLALCFEGGGLAVYRIGQGRATRVYENRYTTEVSAACLDDQHVAISGPERSWIQAVP